MEKMKEDTAKKKEKVPTTETVATRRMKATTLLMTFGVLLGLLTDPFSLSHGLPPRMTPSDQVLDQDLKTRIVFWGRTMASL